MSTIVVFTKDVVGARMAGPGIRAYHFWREMSRVADASLIAAPGEPLTDVVPVDFRSSAAARLMNDARLVIGQPSRHLFQLLRKGTKVIFDLFDPILLELDELIGRRMAPRLRLHRMFEEGRLLRAFRRGDRLICATPQQQQYYERMMRREGLRSTEWLIVPFGVEPDPAPAVERSSRLFIWNGGDWPWLDAELAVRSVQRLAAAGVRCRLLFMGSSRPADMSGVIPRKSDGVIEVNPAWVPYSERGVWLRQARAAVILHRRTAEAEVSIRTRFFDALWAGVPVIASRGGWVSELVERESLGIVVEPESGKEVEDAMRRLLEDDGFHSAAVSNLERVRPSMEWSLVTAPLQRAARELIAG